jgi:hypothetical protein
LYGESGRSRRPSAGLIGLYGDDSPRSSNRSNNASLCNTRDKNTRRVNEIVISRVEDGRLNQRVSGFNTRNRGVSGVNVDSGNLSSLYEVPSGERLSGVSGFVNVGQNDRGSYEYKGVQENPYYVPRELPISLRDVSEYSNENYSGSRERITPTAPRPSNLSTPETMSPLFSSSSNSGSRERIASRAPRASNLSTPETMSALFPSSNNSERSYGSRNEAVNRGWGSFYSNSPRANDSSNSDLERINRLHRKCRDISDGISRDFSKKRR